MDDMSQSRNCCKTGCLSGEIMINHLMYADDLVLLSPSATGLRELLLACVARLISNLPTLFERRTKLCQSYFRKMHNADHKLNKLLPNQRNISYDLRTYNTLPVPLAMTDRLRQSLIQWGLAN